MRGGRGAAAATTLGGEGEGVRGNPGAGGVPPRSSRTAPFFEAGGSCLHAAGSAVTRALSTEKAKQQEHAPTMSIRMQTPVLNPKPIAATCPFRTFWGARFACCSGPACRLQSKKTPEQSHKHKDPTCLCSRAAHGGSWADASWFSSQRGQAHAFFPVLEVPSARRFPCAARSACLPGANGLRAAPVRGRSRSKTLRGMQR